MAKKSWLDPDYRTTPWNRSQYAPKHNGGQRNAMLSEATRRASRRMVLPGLLVLAVAAGGVWVYLTGRPGGVVLLGIFVALGLVFVTVYQILLRRIGEQIKNEELARLTGPASAPDPSPDDNRRFMPPQPTNAAERGQAFEQEVAQLINLLTQFKAVVVGGADDGGVDLKLYRNGKFAGVVQCKRYQGVVPPSAVRELVAVKQMQGVAVAYVVTTGHFSDKTHAEAAQAGIKLIDGARLNQMRAKAKQVMQAEHRR